jgi:ABC-type nitrate/sulfonate/bicarbonate transport system permease component
VTARQKIGIGFLAGSVIGLVLGAFGVVDKTVPEVVAKIIDIVIKVLPFLGFAVVYPNEQK